LHTVAIALQVFCRSELFLHLSEHQWSSDGIRSVLWQNYARVGRAQVAQFYARNMCGYTEVGHELACSIGTVALLDAFYVRLLLNTSQQQVANYLSRHATDWVQMLAKSLSLLPLHMAAYETSTAETWTSKSLKSNDVYSYPTHPTSSALTHRVMSDVSPTISIQQVYSPHAYNRFRPRQLTQVTCIAPVSQRCPFLIFNAKQNNFVEVSNDSMTVEKCEGKYEGNLETFQWNIHRVVWTLVQIPGLVSSPLHALLVLSEEPGEGKMPRKDSTVVVAEAQVAYDLSFLLSNIVG
jgi:hypothetical protein